MLELKRRSIVELPFEVLEQAHWRPSEAQLCCKYKKTPVGREFLRLRNHWRRLEVNVNFSLDALFMSLSPKDLGALARSISTLNFAETYVVDGYCARLKKIIGVPDFVLTDSVNCLLGENKLESSFTLDQYIKYQSFALLCKSQTYLPDRVAAVIIVKDTDPSRFISDYGKLWKPSLEEGILQLELHEVNAIVQRIHANVNALTQKIGSAQAIEFSMDSFRLFPTLVLSWKEFGDKFNLASNRPDLSSALERLVKIANGNFEVASSC